MIRTAHKERLRSTPTRGTRCSAQQDWQYDEDEELGAGRGGEDLTRKTVLSRRGTGHYGEDGGGGGTRSDGEGMRAWRRPRLSHGRRRETAAPTGRYVRRKRRCV